MAQMNAAQIRKALQPMADFAPAIMSALDIIESAEGAEKVLKGLEATKAKLESDITGLQRLKDEHEANARGAQIKLSRSVDECDIKKAELRKELTELANEVTAKNAEIYGLEGVFAERKKAKDMQIESMQKRIDGMNAEIDRIKKQFAVA